MISHIIFVNIRNDQVNAQIYLSCIIISIYKYCYICYFYKYQDDQANAQI